jgi:hypothetical protein
MPARKKPSDNRQFKVGDKVRMNLHHGKIEDAVVQVEEYPDIVHSGEDIKCEPVFFAGPESPRKRFWTLKIGVRSFRALQPDKA